MRAGYIYEHSHMPGVFIKVDIIKKRTNDHLYLTVSWYRRDDLTKKLISMDVQQDMVIPVSEEKLYKEVARV